MAIGSLESPQSCLFSSFQFHTCRLSISLSFFLLVRWIKDDKSEFARFMGNDPLFKAECMYNRYGSLDCPIKDGLCSIHVRKSRDQEGILKDSKDSE